MTIQNFIDSAFEKIRDSFPSSTIEYQFKPNTGIHFFKVSPESIYNSEKFRDFGFNLLDSFYELKKAGELCFISKNSLTEINPTRVDYPLISLANSFYKGTFNQPTHISSIYANEGIELLDIDIHLPFFSGNSLNTDSLIDLSELKDYEKERIEVKNNLGNRQLAMAA